MKILLASVLLFILLPIQAIAGYYGNSKIDEYDPTVGLYYKAIEVERKNRGFMSKGPSTQVTNISIFNPENEKHLMLFKDNKKRNISIVLYETGINEGKVEYNLSGHTQIIKNNTSIVSRPPKNKLLVGVRIEKNERIFTELWVSSKHGENLRLLTTFPVSSDWHIDMRNSKIRIVTASNSNFTQKSFEW